MGLQGEWVNYAITEDLAAGVFEPAGVRVEPAVLRGGGALDGALVHLPHFNDPERDVTIIEVRVVEGPEKFRWMRYRHNPPSHFVTHDGQDPAIWTFDGEAEAREFLAQRSPG